MPYLDKDKQRKFMREWMAERRREFFLGKRCADCQSETELMLFWAGEGKSPGHRVFSFKKERRDAVLEKYTILCGRCRSMRSSSRKPRVHKPNDKPKLAQPKESKVKSAKVVMVKTSQPQHPKASSSRLEWCPVCGAPVSNWQEHFERLGHSREVGA